MAVGFLRNSQPSLISRMRNSFWMAPMSGISDYCFRKLMDEMGAGVLVSELISARGLLYASTKTRRMIRVHSPRNSPVGIQLFGESSEDIAEAAAIVESEDADFLDINLGCPVKKVVKKGCGSALMRNPAALETFLFQIKSRIRLPLTVKMRTGWNADELTIHECVRAAENSGCEWVAIHGRTRAQGYSGISDWDLIRQVKERSHIPIIGNGDIRSAEKAKVRLEESGTDAVMIGRGALRNPWIFRECTGELKPGHEPDRMGLTLKYLEILKNFHDDRHILILLRKLVVWLCHGLPKSGEFRARLFRLHDFSNVVELAEEFFEQTGSISIPCFESDKTFLMGGHG